MVQRDLVVAAFLVPGIAYFAVYGSPQLHANGTIVIKYCASLMSKLSINILRFKDLFFSIPNVFTSLVAATSGHFVETRPSEITQLLHNHDTKFMYAAALITGVIAWRVAGFHGFGPPRELNSVKALRTSFRQVGIHLLTNVLLLFYIPWRTIPLMDDPEFGFFFLPVFLLVFYIQAFSGNMEQCLYDPYYLFFYAIVYKVRLWHVLPKSIVNLLVYCIPPFYIVFFAGPHIYTAIRDPDTFPIKAYTLGHLVPAFPLLYENIMLEERYALLITRTKDDPAFRLFLRFCGLLPTLAAAIFALPTMARLLIANSAAFLRLIGGIMVMTLFVHDWAPMGFVVVSQDIYMKIESFFASLSFVACIINTTEYFSPKSWLSTLSFGLSALRLISVAHLYIGLKSNTISVRQNLRPSYFQGIFYKVNGINKNTHLERFYLRIWRGILWTVEPDPNLFFISPLEIFLRAVFNRDFSLRIRLLLPILVCYSRYGPRLAQFMYVVKNGSSGADKGDVIFRNPWNPNIAADFDAGTSFLFAFYVIFYTATFVNDLIRDGSYTPSNICAAVYLARLCLPLLLSLKVGSDLQEQYGTPIVVSSRRILAPRHAESSENGSSGISWIGPYGHQVMVIGDYKYELRRPSEGVYVYKRGSALTKVAGELEYESQKVGWTRKSPEEIHACCESAYAVYAKHRYHSVFHNCGDFLDLACREVIETKDVRWYMCSDEHNQIIRKLLHFAVFDQGLLHLHVFPFLPAAWLISMALWFCRFTYHDSSTSQIFSLVF